MYFRDVITNFWSISNGSFPCNWFYGRFLDGLGYWFNTQEGFDTELSSGLYWTNPGWANAQPAVEWTDAGMAGTVLDANIPPWAYCTGLETYQGHDSSQGEDCWKWAYEQSGRISYTLIGVNAPHNKYLGYDGNTFYAPHLLLGAVILSRYQKGGKVDSVHTT